MGFAGSAKDKWHHAKAKATEKDLRQATRYSILPAKQNRMCVWWNGRYSAFSKVDLIGNKPLMPLFRLTDETLVRLTADGVCIADVEFPADLLHACTMVSLVSELAWDQLASRTVCILLSNV